MGTQNGSSDSENGQSSDKSESHEFKNSESTKEEAVSKYKCILQIVTHKIAMVPFDITIALSIAFWINTQNVNGSFSVMLGFYASITGIILWPVFPKAARGFYLIALLCMLLSFTIFFASLLPSNLVEVPWICLTFLLCVVFGVAVYEECRCPGQK